MIHIVLSEEDAKLFLKYLYGRPLSLFREEADDVVYNILNQLEDKLDVPGRSQPR